MNKLTTFYDHIRNAMKQEKMSFSQVAKLVTEAGISGTEIEYTELVGLRGKLLAKKLKKAGLGVSGVYCHFRWEQETPLQDYVKVLRRLKELDIHNLLVIPGFKRFGQTSEASAKELAKKVKEVCLLAPKYDVNVVMEDFDDIAAAFASAEELKRFMDEIEELGCAFDTGNFLYMEEDSLEVLPMFIDRIRYVHCKDRSFTPVEGEDYRETIGGRKMYSAAVGSGVIKMKEILDAILETGYEGPLAIEHFGSLKQLSDMTESAGFLQSLISSRNAREA